MTPSACGGAHGLVEQHAQFDGAVGPLLITGAGVGLAVSPSMNTATFRLSPGDTGVGSALANTQQQIGQSIGTSLFNTLAVAATTHYLTDHPAGAGAATLAEVHGYTVAFWWATGILAAGAVICGALLRRGPLDNGDIASGQSASAHQIEPCPIIHA